MFLKDNYLPLLLLYFIQILVVYTILPGPHWVSVVLGVATAVSQVTLAALPWPGRLQRNNLELQVGVFACVHFILAVSY